MLFRNKWKTVDDHALVRASARGEFRAFDVVIHRYQPGLHRFVSRYVGNGELAEDICQESFLRLYARLTRGDGPDIRLGPYLFSIARNLCNDHFRQEGDGIKTSISDLSDARTPLGLLGKKEGLDALAQAVEQLPRSQRCAVLLRHNRDLSQKEIAKIMETSESAVESLLFRARKNLKTMLQP